MSDSRVILQQRRDLQLYEHVIKQLEAALLAQREFIEDMAAVLTAEQKSDLLKKREDEPR